MSNLTRLYRTKEVAKMLGISFDMIKYNRKKANVKPMVAPYKGGIGFFYNEENIMILAEYLIKRKVIPSDWTLPKQDYPKL